MSCRTCRYLAVPPDSLGRIVPRKRKPYVCVFEADKPALPDSYWMQWPPRRVNMEPEDGQNCPAYRARIKETARARRREALRKLTQLTEEFGGYEELKGDNEETAR